jgi:hypothetical protein
VSKRKPSPASTLPQSDADTVYPVPLTGRQIDEIAALFDALCRAGGLEMAQRIAPLIQVLTAPRIAALSGKK